MFQGLISYAFSVLQGSVPSRSAPPGPRALPLCGQIFGSPLILTQGERAVCDRDGDSLPSDRQPASPQQSSTGELHEQPSSRQGLWTIAAPSTGICLPSAGPVLDSCPCSPGRSEQTA